MSNYKSYDQFVDANNKKDLGIMNDQYLPIKMRRLREILPLIEKHGLRNRDIAHIYGVSLYTVNKWIKTLKDAGYEIKPRKKGLYYRHRFY
jgi:biotin operon repressor